MAGKGFLDQYSVFCVFGSVVGCVVVPLITQSIESVIFSAIVISLTATHLSKRAVNTDTSNKVHGQQHKDSSLRKGKESNGLKKKSPKKTASPVEMQVRSSNFRQRKEEKIKQIEQARKLEEQKKQEEKRERKAKKKEERLKQKEEEKKLHEEEERRRKLKGEKTEKSVSPVTERRKSKSKPHVNTTSQKGTWITPASGGRSPTSRKATASPVIVSDSIVTPLDVISPCDALYHEKPLAAIPDGPCSSLSPPPPSVWKVPEYVPPQWHPDDACTAHVQEKLSSRGYCHERLNNDVVLEQRKRPTPLNQLRNPVVPNPVKLKNQYMNQDVSKCNNTPKDSSDPNLLVHAPAKFSCKPDNRLTHPTTTSSPYSAISGLPSFFKSAQSAESTANGLDRAQQKTYSLFGPEEPNRVLFQPIFQGNLHTQ